MGSIRQPRTDRSVRLPEDGSYCVLARRGRDAAVSSALTISSASAIESVVLVLEPALTIRGRVLSAATHAPIETSSVVWTPVAASGTAGRMGFESVGGTKPA